MPPSRALIEAGNEYEQGDNAWFLDLTWPTDLIVSAGSVGSDTWPTELGLPILSYEEYHSNGAPEWPRKCAHEPFEIASAHHVPCIANENTRFPDNDASLIHAFDAAAGAALLAGGSCFHSVRGKTSQLWDGVELECATAWANGARSVPLDCQPLPYRHRADLELAEDLRVYQRGTDDACIVVIRK